MEIAEIIEKTRLLHSREDLLNLLNEIKVGLTGSDSYRFTGRQMAILSNPKYNI